MPQRPASAVIDLTSSQFDLSSQRAPSYPNATAEQRGVKRRRIHNNNDNETPGFLLPSSSAESAARSSQREDDEDPIEAVDLTEVNDDSSLAKVLAKQREDAIKAQAATESREGRTTLTATKCAICMDTPTDATTTVCGMCVNLSLSLSFLSDITEYLFMIVGHMFCHKCIIDSLRYEEQRSLATSAKATRGKCPACRKLLSKKDTPGTRRDLIPLQFKLKQPS